MYIYIYIYTYMLTLTGDLLYRASAAAGLEAWKT